MTPRTTKGILRSYQVVGVDPEIMGIGPAKAIPAALEKAGISIEDVGLFDRHTGHALSQLSYPVLVDVDCGERPLKARKVPCKCAIAGADFQNRPLRTRNEVGDFF